MNVRSKSQITGKHVLLGLMAFFGVVFAVNGVFLTYAIKSFPGEAVEKSYLQGVNYNDTLQRRQTQTDLGWTAQLGMVTKSDGEKLLTARLFDNEKSLLSELSVTATATLADDSHSVQNFELIANTTGGYSAAIDDMEAGRWRFVLNASASTGERFEAMKTVVIE